MDIAAPGAAFSGEVTVRFRRFVSEETGFAVLDCDADGDELVLVGPLAHLEERERAAVVGTWQDDPRYGLQVRVSEAHPLAPAGAEALVAYLRRVRHIGVRRAIALVQAHGPAVLDLIDRDAEGTFASAGLRGERAREAARSWDALRVTRGLHLLLAPHGLAYLASRIHRQYGEAAHRVVRERPYELTSVFGVGFEIADRIARAAGVPRDSPERARAATLHALAKAEQDGSTCLPAPLLARRARELLGVDLPAPGAPVPSPTGAAELAALPPLFADLAADGDLVAVEDGDGVWLYRAPTAALEAELADRVRALLDSPRSDRLRAPATPPAGALPEGHELAPEQWAGVRAAFAHRLSLITGGPGTGKTASIRMIGAIARRQRAQVLLVAPTGRAAVRMTEATGLDAATVHSALGWVPGQGPTHDEDSPLDGDLLIVDETSMANLELLVTLLRAVGPDMHVVLVGDADQLAPVGAGKPFAELVSSGAVPTARLERIFRQAAGSMIVQGAHAIRGGRPPTLTRDEGMRHDLFLIERADPAAARAEIVGLVADRLPRHYGLDPMTDVQVFAPVYRGEVGIDALNRDLREALNPTGEPAAGGRLRIGDKVMLTGRNLHELGLMNGTVLRLIEERGGSEDDEGGDGVLLVAAEQRLFHLPRDEADSLRLAYACSVHKGQGIELPIAVVVAHPAAGAYFLRREMLYTAITRATVATVIVGTHEVVARAARTADTGRRHSRLANRLDPPAVRSGVQS
jgi:exodeoxyribonuclease V alpha subunit